MARKSRASDFIVLESGGIFPRMIVPDTPINQIGVANEQTFQDAAPYPRSDWVLVSGDGVA